MPFSKIALGTVQFGLNYGVSNKNGIPVDDEIERIFVLAKASGIDTLDTAAGYGDAEEKIGRLVNPGLFNIVTKFPVIDSEEALRLQVQSSLSKLNADFLFGYLAHNADNLIQNPYLWKNLVELKKEGKIKKIGYSLYSPEQLYMLLDKDMVPDLVQVPYSILDTKFEVCLPELKKAGTEVHVRSVFLQGLYFMDPAHLPVKIAPLQNDLALIRKYCTQYNVSIGGLALGFALQNPYIDKVVVGVQTTDQLTQNLEMAKDRIPAELFSKIAEIEVIDKDLLNPAKW